MSYVRTSDSKSPTPASEYFDCDTETGDFTVSILAQVSIANPTDKAGFITFKRPGNTSAERDYFAAGQIKDFVVEKVYGSDGGTSGLSGSTCRAQINGGFEGFGDAGSTTTTTTAGA